MVIWVQTVYPKELHEKYSDEKPSEHIFHQDYYVSGELCWCQTKEDEKKRYNGLHTFITAEGKYKTSAKCIKLPGFYHKNDM